MNYNKKPLWIALASLLATPLHAYEFEAGGVAFEFTGELEFDVYQTEGDDGVTSFDESDSFLATAEFGLAARFTDHLSANLVLLAEDIDVTDASEFDGPGQDRRPDRLHVEELTVSYAGDDWELFAGRMATPFGSYESPLISDPITLEIGETKTDLGFGAAYTLGDLTVNAVYYDRNHYSRAPDEDGFTINATYAVNEMLSIGGGYLDVAQAAEGAPSLFNLHAHLNVDDRYGIDAEWVGANRERNGEKPSGYFIAGWYSPLENLTLGVRYQGSKRFSMLEGGDGDYREWGLAATYDLTDHIGVGLEYTSAEEGPADADTILGIVTLSW